MLYGAGLTARAGELVAAGFSPQEVLPWIPIQQGLARGAALLMEPAVVLVFLAFASGWIVQLLPDGPGTAEWWARRRQHAEDFANVIAGAASAVEEAGHPKDVADARRRLDKVTQLMTPPSSNYHADLSVHELKLAGHDVRSSALRHGVDNEATAELATALGERKRPREHFWIALFLFGAVAITLAWLVLTVELAWMPASVAMAAIFFGLLFERGTSAASVQWQKPAIVCTLVLFVLGHAYLGAAPLQHVELRLPSGKTLRGQLLGSPGTQTGTWYVSPAKHEIIAVSGADPITIRDSTEPGRFDDYSLWDAIRGREDNAN